MMKKKTGKTKYRKTKGEIDKMQDRYLKNLKKQIKKQEKEKHGIGGEIPINMNHVYRDEMLQAQEEGKEYATASGIDGAIDITNAEAKIDRHPEKRRKAVSNKYNKLFRHLINTWRRIYLESRKNIQV